MYDDAQADYLRSANLPGNWRRNAGTPEYAFNEYVQITVEHGIIGIVLFLGIVYSCFFFRGRTFEDKESDNVITAVRGGLLTFLVFSFFSYPFSVLPLTVLFVVLTAAAASLSPPFERKLPRFAGMAVAVACLCPAGYASAEILSRYPAYREWKQVQTDYDSGYFKKAIDDYPRLYPELDCEKAFLYEYARCLSVVDQYESSNEILDRYLLFGNDPVICYLKAGNYRNMNDYKAAGKMYLHSLEILPNHFYTIHLLLNLYDETGQTEKAQEIRKMIESRRKKATERRRGKYTPSHFQQKLPELANLWEMPKKRSLIFPKAWKIILPAGQMCRKSMNLLCRSWAVRAGGNERIGKPAGGNPRCSGSDNRQQR